MMLHLRLVVLHPVLVVYQVRVMVWLALSMMAGARFMQRGLVCRCRPMVLVLALVLKFVQILNICARLSTLALLLVRMVLLMRMLVHHYAAGLVMMLWRRLARQLEPVLASVASVEVNGTGREHFRCVVVLVVFLAMVQ